MCVCIYIFLLTDLIEDKIFPHRLRSSVSIDLDKYSNINMTKIQGKRIDSMQQLNRIADKILEL